MAATVTGASGQSFLGFIAAVKGKADFYSTQDFMGTKENDEVKIKGGFGFHPGAGIEAGYSYRTPKGLTLGGTIGGGYDSNETEIIAEDLFNIEMDNSGLFLELKGRVGYVINNNCHIFVGAGPRMEFANSTLNVKETHPSTKKTNEIKAEFKDDKAPGMMKRLSLVADINLEYAVTSNVNLGMGVGIKYPFSTIEAEATDFNPAIDEDLRYSLPMTIGVNVFVSFSM